MPLPAFEEAYVPIGGAKLHDARHGDGSRAASDLGVPEVHQSSRNQARFAVATGYMVSRRSALETDTWRNFIIDEPRAQVTYMQVNVAHPRPQLPFWDEIQQRLRDELSDVMYRDNGNFVPVLEEIVRYGNMKMAEWNASR